jgi:TRAP-type C4-dicarboxylate transport system permease small subunit
MLKLLADTSNTINLQTSNETSFGTLSNLTFPSIISALIRLAVVIAAIVFFFILVIGGIRWIASGGDKAQTEAARNQITSALVGLVIVFAAWAIVALINVFFGINIFSLAIPTV